MKQLKSIGFSLFLALGACGGGGAAELEKLKNEACACKDKACAEAVNKKMDAVLEKMKEPDPKEAEKLMKIMTEAGVCLAKHMGGE